MPTLEHHENWNAYKQILFPIFQHYRRLRVKCMKVEKPDGEYYDYPSHIMKIIENQLLPSLRAEDYITVRDLSIKIEDLRLKWEFTRK